jgi:hypothetical protein
MSSGEPMDVTISMRVHGAEMKLGKLASGPTGQLEIDTREVLTVQPSTTEEAIAVLVRQFERSGSQDRDIRRRTALGNHYMEEFKLWTQPSKHFFLSRSSV